MDRYLSTSGNRPTDLYSTFSTLLGSERRIALEELASTRIGLVAPSLAKISHAVWFVRAPDTRAVDRWFPKSKRTAEDRSRFTYTFRTEDGLIVCIRGKTIAIARRREDDGLLLATMRVMSGRSKSSLDALAAFQSAHRWLPAKPDATVYVASPKPNKATQEITPSLFSWSSPVAIGIYLRDDRLDLTIRGSMSHPLIMGELTPYTVETVRRLPQSTLFAAAASFDFDAISERLESANDPGAWMRYLRLLGRLRGSGRSNLEPLPRLGPQVIGVWGQDMRPGKSSPQMALFLECADGDRMRDEVTVIVQNLIVGITSVDLPGVGGALTIERSTHLGTPIVSVPLAVFSETSRYPIAPLLANIEPAWAARDGWFIFALSRSHIERMIDAMLGLSPVLSTTPGGRSLWQPRLDIRFVCVVQSHPAFGVLDTWLADHNAGRASLLDEWWWSGPQRRNALRPSRLGIGMRMDSEPGVVIVARVDAGTAADGFLEPEDRILGIDGFLLGLQTPTSDLRRRWRQRSSGLGSTLRVRRGGEVLDVALARGSAIAALDEPGMIPAEAIRVWMDLGRTITGAGLVVQSSDSGAIAAELSLYLAAPSTTRPPAP